MGDLDENKTLAVFEANKGVSKNQKEDIAYLTNMGSRFGGWILNKANIKQR